MSLPLVNDMADVVDSGVRSRIMASVKGRDTSAEMKVRRILHRLGYRYRVHGAKLPGKPDLVFTKRKKVVFVHGCFWHGHEECVRSKRPASGTAYWNAKLDRNMERDKSNMAALKEADWNALVVWECELRKDDLADRLIEFLGAPSCQ